jgi:hypothetical protein
MKREMEGEELWTRFLIRFVLIASLIWLVAKVAILTITIKSPL